MIHRSCLVHTSRLLDCLIYSLAMGSRLMRIKHGILSSYDNVPARRGGLTSLLDLPTKHSSWTVRRAKPGIVSCVASKLNLTSLHESGA